MFDDWIIESAQCIKCRQPMTILIGMGAPGVFRIMDMYQTGTSGILRGSYQCGLCSGYCCYDCSDYGTPCVRCKACQWNERQYVADPQIAAQLESAAGQRAARAEMKQPPVVHQDGSVFLTAAAAGLPPEISIDELNRYLELRGQASQGLLWVALPPVLAAIGAGWWRSRSSPGWTAVLTGAGVLLVSFQICLLIAAGRNFGRGIVWSCPQCKKRLQISSNDPPSAWKCRTPGCGFSHFQFWRSRQ